MAITRYLDKDLKYFKSLIEEKIEKGLDPLGRSNILTTVPLDDSFPEYIINNQDKYMEFIKLWNWLKV